MRVKSRLLRPGPILRLPVSRESDEPNGAPDYLTQPSRDLVSVDVRQSDIDQDYGWGILLRQTHSLVTGRRLQHLIAGHPQQETEHLSSIAVVFDYQNAARGQLQWRGWAHRRLDRAMRERQPNDEFASLAQAVTPRLDVAVVHFYKAASPA